MSLRRWRFLGLSVGRAMINRPTRVLLLAAALAITAALATALIAVSQGVEARLSESLKAFGANLVVDSSTRQVGAGALSLGEVEAELDPEVYVPAISAVPGVESVKPRVRINASVGGQEVLILGISTQDMAAAKWKLTGALPERGQVLVGTDAARQLRVQQGSTAPGLEGLTVAGVIEAGSEEDGAIVMRLDDALGLTGGKVSEFLVRADGRTLGTVSKAIEGIDPLLATRTIRQVAEAERSLLDKVRELLLIVTLSVALVSSIAVGNTQSIIVLERTQEIGLLKAMGATKRFIVSYFALEGGAIAFAGGLVGLLVGIAVAEAIAAGVFGAPIPIPAVAWPVPFVVAGTVSFLAGAVPVWRASAVDAAMTLKGL